MADRADITPELCRQLLRYENETGKLFWLPRDRDYFLSQRSHAVWNGKFSGKEAFTASSRGYRVGMIMNRMMKAHRVAWAIYYGEWPIVIDHINGDPSDNRIVNLRSIEQGENLRNLAVRSDNKSTRTGVYLVGQRWCAEIFKEGVKHRLGTFATFEDASAARASAEEKMGFHPNHGSR